MLGQKEIAEIQLRKRALVIESDLNRLTLRAEWQHICAATGGLNQAARFCRRANPWLVLLTPLAGLWTARSLNRGGGIASRLFAALKWIPPLLAIWRNFAGPRPEEGDPGVTSPSAPPVPPP